TVSDPYIRDTLITLGLCSSLTVPLRTRTRVLGTFTLVSAESRRRFTERDVRLAIDIGRRAANAIEQALLYQDLREFRTTLDNTRDAVLLFDPATLRFFYVNQGATEQLGYSREELIGMTPLDIKPEFDEARYRRMLEPLISGELQSYTFETIHRLKNGTLIDVEVSLQYVTHPGMPGRFITVVRDISERNRVNEALRASERRFRHLADSMPLHVWITNLQGDASFFNKRWFEYTGLTQEQASKGRVSDLIHPDDYAATMQSWERSLESGTPFEHEYRLRGADGQYRWFLLRAVPYNTASNTIDYWIGTSTDIDEHKRNVANLQERRAELERLTLALADRNRELDQFAYITSHDLKAPLRGIGNLAQWIEEDLGENVSADVRSYLDLLKGRVLRMEALIDGILQFSRVGRTSGDVEQVDTGELVREVIDMLAPPANVSIDVAPDMPILQSYRLPLTQVFSNLIGNAVKHNADMPLHISIAAQLAGRFVEFSVRDDGQGIAPQYHERVFGIFQTLASRDKVEGSGLGLALVKKIVEHMRGHIRLESDEGAGATFSFTWPTHV
ncbi:MAG TPA: PAS domain S-box protein, partial [Roseiflexaceae bacterium]|nr:PAS domain S-box protein [Roseiflexaceae bacterium]